MLQVNHVAATPQRGRVGMQQYGGFGSEKCLQPMGGRREHPRQKEKPDQVKRMVPGQCPLLPAVKTVKSTTLRGSRPASHGFDIW